MKRQGDIHKDIQLLVKAVTEIEEDDENFKLCMGFAESNFKYHRFLGPDSHKLDRRVDGLVEKLQVHSQPEKAACFRSLVDQFLDISGLEGRDYGKTDSHYAMLSLLIELADSPSNADFTPTPKALPQDEVVDDFDWKAYLLDPEDVDFMAYHLSDTSSEEESLSSTEKDDDEEDDDKNLIDELLAEESRLSSEANSTQDTTTTGHNRSNTVRSREGLSLDPSKRVLDQWSVLESALVVQYWSGKGREEESAGGHCNSNLIRDWNCYQRQVNQFFTPMAEVLVTEAQIVRETLWMLSGVKDLFIFKFNGREFHLNPEVYVTHLTQEALESSLRPMMEKASQLQSLLTFVSEVTSQLWQGQGSAAMPQTYQAFACCLSTFISDFGARLVELEKEIISQENMMTVDKLHKELDPWLEKVQVVHGVYLAGVASHPYLTATRMTATAGDAEANISTVVAGTSTSSNNNCSKASLLLNVLYEAVQAEDLVLPRAESGQVCSLLLEMLLKSVEPLLQIISDWINFGQLSDPAGEFVLHRNEEIRSLEETFWEKAFISNIPTAQEDNLQEMSAFSSSSTSTTTTTNRTATSTTTTNPRPEVSSQMNDSITAVVESLEMGDSANKLPTFLRPILGQAILAGKSMEMLETLGSLACAKREQPVSLSQHLLKDLESRLTGCFRVRRLGPQLSHGTLDQQDRSTGNADSINRVLSGQGQRDTLLEINIANVFPTERGSSRKKGQHSREDFRIESSEQTSLSQVLRVCEGCLVPYVQSRYQTVCSHLLDTLKSEYRLMEFIHAMQRYFLMSAGQVMYDFYTAVFHKIEKQEVWKEESLLTMYLHEAMDSAYPSDTSRLSVQLVATDHPPSDQQAISVTDCVQLHFAVPWPVDVVISTGTQNLYNSIFTFILQIKRSKFSLVQLRYKDLSRPQKVEGSWGWTEPVEDPMSRGDRVHRFQLLRFRLLDFVNSLHNYIMTRILHSTGLEFGPQLESASDLEQVISLHGQYVMALHDRCLLHPRLSVLRKAVLRVLNLCLACGAHWQQGVDFVSGKVIEEMERELTRIVHFLSSFLSNVIKRGSFPHLESLAFAMASSLQNVKLS